MSLAIHGQVANWTVLIVDDEPDNRVVPQELLKFYGAKVFSAENGREGLKSLAEMMPTFILLDLSMPEMDGWEMLKQIRADPRLAHLPVIALTAHAMAGDMERVFEAGFNGYIAKPYLLDTFWVELERCLTPAAQAQK